MIISPTELPFTSLASIAPWAGNQYHMQNPRIKGNSSVLSFIWIVLIIDHQGEWNPRSWNWSLSESPATKSNPSQVRRSPSISRSLASPRSSLRLEWNQLGAMHSPAFSVFCDALAENRALIELDLRNNDINHVSASELVSGLKRNTTLRVLGRWERRIDPFYGLPFELQIFAGTTWDWLVVELS